MTRPVVGRLAPTPSGLLHLGNVCAFAGAWLSARRAGGRVLLRIEDIDAARARRAVEQQIRADLTWLGLVWDAEVPRQSTRDYGAWLAALAPHVYHCGCTRAESRAAGRRYPGTCRNRGLSAGAVRFRLPTDSVSVVDRRRGALAVELDGLSDPVLRRRDGVYSYMLGVVADDIADGVTEVVRGADLLELTAPQLCLWRALGATPPTWCHAPLVLGPDGRKLSKSFGAAGVSTMRAAGWTPADIWQLVWPWLGMRSTLTLNEAVAAFDPARMLVGPVRLTAPAASSSARPGGIAWQVE